jgi:hypothetical protein
MANDNDREDFVNNDEGLYNMWRRSGKGITVWVRENRQFIDEYMGNVQSGAKPAHYGAYGG